MRCRPLVRLTNDGDHMVYLPLVVVVLGVTWFVRYRTAILVFAANIMRGRLSRCILVSNREALRGREVEVVVEPTDLDHQIVAPEACLESKYDLLVGHVWDRQLLGTKVLNVVSERLVSLLLDSSQVEVAAWPVTSSLEVINKFLTQLTP